MFTNYRLISQTSPKHETDVASRRHLSMVLDNDRAFSHLPSGLFATRGYIQAIAISNIPTHLPIHPAQQLAVIFPAI